MTFIRAFEPDEDYDRAHASDGISRYGVYLVQYAHMFIDENDRPTTDPAQFAGSAWEIAHCQTMAPSYVRTHGRVQQTSTRWDDDWNAAVFVMLAVSAPPEAAGFTYPWRRWTGDELGRWVSPPDLSRPTALTMLQVEVPLTGSICPAPVTWTTTPAARTRPPRKRPCRSSAACSTPLLRTCSHPTRSPGPPHEHTAVRQDACPAQCHGTRSNRCRGSAVDEAAGLDSPGRVSALGRAGLDRPRARADRPVPRRVCWLPRAPGMPGHRAERGRALGDLGGLDIEERPDLARQGGFPPPNVVPRHGVHTRYVRHHCRCDACRYAHARYERERRRRRKAAAA